MKVCEATIMLSLAVAMAVGTTLLYSGAGYGAAGILILGSLLATATFSLLGGRMRVLLVAIAVVPPFAAATIDNFSSAQESLSAWDALMYIMPAAAAGFVLFVALPIILVFLVFHFSYRRRTKSC
jgi:hypothetical protein